MGEEVEFERAKAVLQEDMELLWRDQGKGTKGFSFSSFSLLDHPPKTKRTVAFGAARFRFCLAGPYKIARVLAAARAEI